MIEWSFDTSIFATTSKKLILKNFKTESWILNHTVNRNTYLFALDLHVGIATDGIKERLYIES